MKRDDTHRQFDERWAEYVRNNPNWREIHAQFINSQFQNAYNMIDKLKKTKNGRQKIIEIYRIKNKKGYPNLLRDKENN